MLREPTTAPEYPHTKTSVTLFNLVDISNMVKYLFPDSIMDLGDRKTEAPISFRVLISGTGLISETCRQVSWENVMKCSTSFCFFSSCHIKYRRFYLHFLLFYSDLPAPLAPGSGQPGTTTSRPGQPRDEEMAALRCELTRV